jgi:hypothetical protein
MPPNDDDACRATAERINRSRPQWLVMWGCYSRLYWAYPLFEMRSRILVRAAYPDALVAHMDEVERRFRVWPERKE